MNDIFKKGIKKKPNETLISFYRSTGFFKPLRPDTARANPHPFDCPVLSNNTNPLKIGHPTAL
jgi:hypothetical protein